MRRRRSSPTRIAGDLSLDLANTFNGRGTAHEVDHLPDVDAILTWARDAGLVEDLPSLEAGDAERLVEEVQRLRRAVAATGEAIANRDVPPVDALAVIRDLASETLRRASLHGVPASLSFTGLDRVVGPLAWAALDLFRGSELSRLKRCPPEDCHWLFIDRTKNGSRRWCDMATCGNRAKKRLR